MKLNKRKHNSKITYGLEFFIFVLLAAGLYFILSDVDLATVIRQGVLQAGDQIAILKQDGMIFVNTTLAHLALSDMVGIVIIGLTIILSIHRFRHRLVVSHELVEECPDCGQVMVRRHRTIIQRMVAKSLGLKSASFRCKECNHQNLIFRYKVPRTGLS